MAETLLSALTTRKFLQPIPTRGGGGWMNLIREPFAGAWQQNKELSNDTILQQTTVFACITLIAGDISKLPWGLRQRDGRIWKDVSNPAYDPVLRLPNTFQNSQQFRESWILSKLIYGNTYALKGRDQRGVVKRMWVLNPRCVQPLVTESGEVYYRLNKDPLTDQFEDEAVVPASEVIHDRFNTMFHPLVGLSPLYAAASVAGHSLEIQNSTTKFFGNGARPSGILVAPGAISDANAKQLKEYWDANYAGANAGKVAVLGDGLTYTQMQMTSTDAQLIEQLRWDSEEIARVFHVPAYKVGVGTAPTYNNYQALNLDYYTTCLQPLMEAMEWCLWHGLNMAEGLEVHIDTGELLRMDSVTQMDLTTKAISGGVMKPNEGRETFNLSPVEGGDAVYMQVQNQSLEAIAKRDRQVIDGTATEVPLASAPAALNPPALDSGEIKNYTLSALTKALTEYEKVFHLQANEDA